MPAQTGEFLSALGVPDMDRPVTRPAGVAVGLETGRKHQIRVHLTGLGCPVIGDTRYGAASDPAGRLGLHAWRLVLDHPTTGQRLELESPLPDALRQMGLG